LPTARASGSDSGPTREELANMSREQLVDLGGERDEVKILAKTVAWAKAGDKAERRAERLVAMWFVLSALFGLAFVIVLSVWPHTYVDPFHDGYTLYALYTPMLGITFGGAALFLGVAVVSYAKRLLPDEVSIQQVPTGPSKEIERATAAARFEEAGQDIGLGRRTLLRRAGMAAAAMFAVSIGALAIGPFVRKPWRGGDQAALWVTGWRSFKGETVYLRADSGVTGHIVKVRPEDMEPGSMQTVYPYRDSDAGDEELLRAAVISGDSPVMLFRLHADTKVIKRPGQEDFNYGDYYAFSKICTHLGCPASEYDHQNQISLCPCHQSEFSIADGARPVFGPATRPLPQLPITVDKDGYFVAKGDFIEPVGPTFWEIRSSGPTR
jgi:ubiquinol-cytochrome c reductase iron-sulfur subunit